METVSKDPTRTFANGPHRDQYLQEMNREVLAHYDDMAVGEAFGITLDEEPDIVDENRHELNMVFNFDAVRINRGAGYSEVSWTLPQLKGLYDEHARVLGKQAWDTVFLGNHDNPRLVSTFGDDSPQFRVQSAKLLQTMLLTLRGTPFLYQGDELGMTNYPFTLDDFNDIEIKNGYKAKVLTGQMSEGEFLKESRRFGRDNARTPMQWDTSAHGGFTPAAATPWLVVNPNYKEINAAAELTDLHSVLQYTKAAIALHRANLAFTYGDYTDLDPANPQVYAYTRTLGDARFLIVLNFSRNRAEFQVPSTIKLGKRVLGNLHTADQGIPALSLEPWEARVYRF
jgi:oligo-1,6-glucosidase